MEIDKEFWATLFFTVLNILVLYFILKKLLFKPVTKYMDTRSNKIKEALDMAEEAKQKVEAMEKEHKARLKEVKEEGIALMESYKQKALNEYNSIIADAKEESKRMIENTRDELEIEKEQLVTTLKEEISGLVLEASEKVLNKNLDNKANRQLISEFIKEEK
jgi:F-type H+-transporting ATPase subunit b